MKYNEYKQLDMTQLGEEIRRYWEENEIFEKGQKLSEGHNKKDFAAFFISNSHQWSLYQ